MKYPIIVPLICLCFYCCKKENQPYKPLERCPDLTNNMDTISKYIDGNWIWLEEKRWDRVKGEYEYLTPQTEGYTLQLVLSGDTARFYKNNDADSVYKFKILRESDIETWQPDDTLPVIAFFGFSTGVRQSYVPIKICKDQLLMQHQFVSSIVGERIWNRY